MDLAKLIDKFGDFIANNTLEIACVAVSTAAYQVYLSLKEK
jgi:hypothetical protein